MSYEWRIKWCYFSRAEGLSWDDRRGEPRRRSAIKATARERSRQAVPVNVTNISTGGCRLELRQSLSEGTLVWLKLPGLESRASRVVWSHPGSAGLAFAEPLHVAVVDLLVPRSRRLAR